MLWSAHVAAIAAALQRAITANAGQPAPFDAVVEQLQAVDARAAAHPLLVELVLDELARDPTTTVVAIHRAGEAAPRYGTATPPRRRRT